MHNSIKTNNMPRPRKFRHICCSPDQVFYGPKRGFNEENEHIILNLDEFETIRLIDLEGFTQEDCATSMQVSRATVQAIYEKARKTLAISLVQGKTIKIEGGDVQYLNEQERGRFGCGRHRKFNQETESNE